MRQIGERLIALFTEPGNDGIRKAQFIRLLDVFVLGPLMIAVAAKAETVGSVQRLALAGTGVGTILFNGRNYLVNRELE